MRQCQFEIIRIWELNYTIWDEIRNLDSFINILFMNILKLLYCVFSSHKTLFYSNIFWMFGQRTLPDFKQKKESQILCFVHHVF